MLRAISSIVLLTFGCCAQEARTPSAPFIAGVVRSAGQPIPGATVTAIQGDIRLFATSDEEGRFAFERVLAGSGKWFIEVQMFGFLPVIRDAEVENAPVALGIEMELKPREAAKAADVRPAAAPAAGAAPTVAAKAPQAPQATASPSRPQTARTPAAAAQGRRPGGGFQTLALNQSTDAQIQETLERAPAAEAPGAESSNANESFLVNGSLSGGVQPTPQDEGFGRRPGFDQMGGGMGNPDGQPGFGAGGMGGRGGAGGGGGFGGGGGGFGGGGFGGGRGGFGGGGGFGGRGGPGMRGGPGGAQQRNMNFGNRAGRGRQTMRGAVFYTLANAGLDSRPYSLTGQTVDKASYGSSRFGVVLGGPLRIPKIISSDKTFIFITYMGTRGHTPYSATSTLPTPLERAGDFSQSTVVGAPVRVFDPLSNHLPFENNAIPLTRVNSAAAGLLAYIPLPTQTGGVQNYQYVNSISNSTDNLGVRLGRSITKKDRLDFNVNTQFRNGNSRQLYGFTDASSGTGANVSAGWTRNISTHLISRFNVTFSRNRTELVPYFAYGTNVAAELGILGVSDNPANYGPPNLSFTNFGGLSDGSPSLVRNQTAGLTESVSLMKTKHTVSLGGGYRRMQLNTRTDQNGRGTFTFSGLASSAFDDGGQPLKGTGYDFADFLLGLPQSSSVRYGDTSTYFRGSAYSAFAMDDWRLRPNLTVNLGLRYEYFTPFSELRGHIANLDIAPGFTGVAVVTPGAAGPYSGVFPAGLVNPDKNNASPRVAIAWRPVPKKQTLVRAGYGIFFNGSIYNTFPSRLAAQPPFANSASVNTSLENPLTIQEGFTVAPTQTITNTYAVDRYYRPGYAQTWNFGVQQSLPHQLVLELSYMGTKGTDLDLQRMPNRAAPGSPLTAEQRRLIGNATGFTFDSSVGNSIYHALQTRFTRRFARGISWNAMYIFSKSIDNASSLGGGGATVAQNDQDLRAERGISSFSRPHTLNTSWVLTSPVAESGGLLHASGWALRMMRDWTVSGSLAAQSGGVLTARVLGNQSDTGGTGSVGSGRADATGLPLYDGSGFFNLAAFAVPPSGRYGDAGRNTIRGPSQFTVNLSLSRSFRVDERRRLELRFDTLNTLNEVNILGLGTVVNASNYGLPTSAGSMRTATATARLRF